MKFNFKIDLKPPYRLSTLFNLIAIIIATIAICHSKGLF